MPQIRERDEENSSRKKRHAKMKRGPGVFVYDGSLHDPSVEPTPLLVGTKEPVFDASGMPVADGSGRQVFQRAGIPVTDERGEVVRGGTPRPVHEQMDTWTIRGVVFPEGKAVRVADAALALKLRGMDGFAELEGEAAEAADEPEAPKRGRGRRRKVETELEGEAAES